MGRSVDYLTGAETVIYFTADWMHEQDENGNYDEFMSQMNWDDFLANLKAEIKSKLKSYEDCQAWDGREVNIFLDNMLCEIGISEYCGLYSLSVRAKEADYYSEKNTEALGQNHAKQIDNTLCKILQGLSCTVLNRVGTFSNGTGVFQEAGKTYENRERIL